MYQYIPNVPLQSHWSKVTYSQVHGSSMLKTLSFQSVYWISTIRLSEMIKFWQDLKFRKPKTYCKKI